MLRFYRKLEDLNIGVLTFGLAFHIQQTSLLRFPYNKEEFFEQVTPYQIELASNICPVQQLHLVPG